MKNFIHLFVGILLLSTVGFASDQEFYFQRFMMQFQKNPSRAMNMSLPKFDRNGNTVVVAPKVTFEQRLRSRDAIRNRSKKYFSAAIKGSRIENFFPDSALIQRKIEKMDTGLLQGSLELAPWSSDYWPTYKGGIGARYADPTFPDSSDFKDYYVAYQNFFPLNYDDQTVIDNLSPAEKYDILVGDESFSMTHWTFEDANETYLQNKNEIETWFGLCHGWAPASFMLSRPEKTVTYAVENFQGKNIELKFYPDDVKALSSLLWANTTLETYFLGGRCNTKFPNQDAVGRITDEDCFDINPGSWHMAVINQLGASKRSLVIDASYDYEIWNQPVSAYKVSYFHPQTKKKVETLSEGLIPVEDFSQDQFKKYRNDKTRFIVGINMSLSYILENTATHAEENNSTHDRLRSVEYIYDLEINENGEIIGGEWYQNMHPDFLWAPNQTARAVSIVDRELRGPWLGNVKIPKQWTKSASFASTYGQPLANVVEGLIHRAKAE